MDWIILADCLWAWGGFTISLCIIKQVTEWDCRINLEDYWQRREEDGV